jgi:hypothetical protein
MTELDLDAEWIGAGNRESQTQPVLSLRESAVRLGLLRKHRGKLMITSRGRALAADPLALWWHIADRLPLRSAHEGEMHAGLICLILVAAQVKEDQNATIAYFLDHLGWLDGDGVPMSPALAGFAALDTADVIRRLGATADSTGSLRASPPTTEATALARAALRTWPGLSPERA